MTKRKDIENIVESIILENGFINWGQYTTNDLEGLIQKLSNYVEEQQK